MPRPHRGEHAVLKVITNLVVAVTDMRKPFRLAALIEHQIAVAVAQLFRRRRDVVLALWSDAEPDVEDLQAGGQFDVDIAENGSGSVVPVAASATA